MIVITSRRQRFASTLAGPALVIGITLALAACGDDGAGGNATPGIPPGISAAVATAAPPAPASNATGEATGDGGTQAAPELPAGDPAQGASIVEAKGCMSCHQIDTDAVGPRWGGLWGSEVELEGGGTVLADEAYVRRAILEPEAERHAGFFVQMPVIPLSDEELSAVVAYIASLG